MQDGNITSHLVTIQQWLGTQEGDSQEGSEVGAKPKELRVRPPCMYTGWMPADQRTKSNVNPRASWFVGREVSQVAEA